MESDAGICIFFSKALYVDIIHSKKKKSRIGLHFENDFVTSFHSFITGQPAVENIQLLQGSVLWSMSREKLNVLLDRFPEIERVVRIIYENYYIRLEERFINSQFKSAAERYQNLLEQAPHIVERVPLGYIASYLGITQQTLSVIRSMK